jgi:hypothetical protein
MFKLSTLAVILSAVLSSVSAREPLCGSVGDLCDFDSDCCTNHHCVVDDTVNGIATKTCSAYGKIEAPDQRPYGAPKAPTDPQAFIEEKLTTNKGANPMSKWGGRNVQFPASKAAKTPVVKTATKTSATSTTTKKTRK